MKKVEIGTLTQSRDQEDEFQPGPGRYVTYRREHGLTRITMCRPEALNAINKSVLKQMEEAFLDAESDQETKAIILDAVGAAFGAGADIGFFTESIKNGRIDKIIGFTAFGQNVLNRIDDCKKLVVAKIEGMALGGGLELALCADVIVATPGVKMGFPETGVGIYPGFGGTQRTSRRIGKELAKYLILSCRRISADEAYCIGLVDYVFAADEIESTLVTLIADDMLVPRKARETEQLPGEWQRLKELFADERMEAWLSGEYLDSDDPLVAKTAAMVASKAPLALRLAHKIIDSGYKVSLTEGLKHELAHLEEIWYSRDALTGLTSVGKGSPKFQGR